MKDKELQEKLQNHRGLRFSLNDKSNRTDILYRTLENRGVSDFERFENLEPGTDFTPTDPAEFSSLMYWAQRFIDTQNFESDICILVDNDADGMTSAAMLMRYLSILGYCNINFVFSEGKSHGLKKVIDNIVGLHPDFLFVPDAGSNDILEQNVLSDASIPYLILDHHDIDPKSLVEESYLPIINSHRTTNGNINRNFTGVGMVYMFCKAIDLLKDEHVADSLLYYLSVGQISDVSDVSDPEIRYLMLKGFKLFDRPLFNLAIDLDNISPHALSFGLIPLINATCRVGSIEDKEKLINGLSGRIPLDDMSYEIKRRVKGKDGKIHVQPFPSDFYTYEIKQLTNIKARQKKSVTKSLSAIEKVYDTPNFVVAVDYDGNFESSQSGLIATQLANKYQKPALILHEVSREVSANSTNEVIKLGGSGRGYEKVMSNFKEYLVNTDLFEFCAGHPNAFGVGISSKSLSALISQEQGSTPAEQPMYEIDAVYLDSVPTKNDIFNFDSHRSMFGGHVSEPTLGFVSLQVAKTAMRLRKTTLTFMNNGITFIKFGTSKEEFQKIIEMPGSQVCIDIVGAPEVNRYGSYETPQIMIEDFTTSTALQESQKIDYDQFVF